MVHRVGMKHAIDILEVVRLHQKTHREIEVAPPLEDGGRIPGPIQMRWGVPVATHQQWQVRVEMTQFLDLGQESLRLG